MGLNLLMLQRDEFAFVFFSLVSHLSSRKKVCLMSEVTVQVFSER